MSVRRVGYKNVGFKMVNLDLGGQRRTFARFTCDRCEADLDISITTGASLNAEGLAKSAVAKGWAASPTHANRTLCPGCLAVKETTDVDSELRKVQEKMDKNNPPAPPVVTTLHGEITQEQRGVVRQLLTMHFDEGGGYYRDLGVTDASIAQKVGVSEVSVRRIRDAAFGPIRIAPEVIAMRQEVSDLRAALEQAQHDAVELIATVQSDFDKLRERLAKIEIELRVGEVLDAGGRVA